MPKKMDKATLKDSQSLYTELIESDQPWNAAECLVGYLLELGYDQPEAHSALCTLDVLYEAGIVIE